MSVNNRMEDLPISISIIDNGKGISDDLIDKIFEPFVGTKAGGSGLGLSLVSKIIADHGGTIELNSNPGKTCFSRKKNTTKKFFGKFFADKML